MQIFNKRIMYILLGAILCMMFGIKSYAADSEKMEALKEQTLENYNFQLSDSMAEEILNYWQNHPDNYMYSGKTGSTWFAFIFTADGTRYDENNRTVYVVNGDRIYNINTDGSSYGFTNSANSFTAPNGFEYGLYDEFGVDVDYLDFEYNPRINAPEYDVYWNTGWLGDVGPDVTLSPYDIPFEIVYKNSANNAYWGTDDNEVEQNGKLFLSYRFYVPKSYTVVRKSGYYEYTVNEYAYSDYYEWYGIELDSNTNLNLYLSDLNALGSNIYPQSDYLENQMRNDYAEFLSNVTQTFNGESYDPTIHGFGFQNDGNYIGVWGNRVEVNMCYYTKWNDTYYRGDYSKWTVTVPEKWVGMNAKNYPWDMNGSKVSSYSVLLDGQEVEEDMENTDVFLPSNIPDYGTIQNVVSDDIASNIPNTMNYPTITQYNHDNIFTTFVSTYQTAGKTLKDYGQFFAQAVTWIPGEIWSIIGMGFSMAIVIMVIKVL